MKKKSSEKFSSSKRGEKKPKATMQPSEPQNDSTGKERVSAASFSSNDMFIMLEDSLTTNFVTLPSGKLVYCNKAYLALFGYKTKEEALNSHVQNLYPSIAAREHLLKELTKNKKLDGLEAVHITNDGRTIHTLENTLGIFDKNGELIKIIGNIIDVTERKQTEELSRKSASKLHAIFSAMTDVIIVLDSHGKYLEIAPTNPSLLYKPPTELLGKTLHEIFPVEQADFFLSKIKKSLQTQQTVPLEYSLNIENKQIWFSALVSPMESDSVLLVARDISEQKKAEDKIKKLNRLYTLLSNVNQSIVRSSEPEKIFDHACQIAVDDGKFVMAWIGIVNSSTNKVDVVSSSGFKDNYLEKVNIDLNDKKRSGGIVGKAIKNEKYFIVNNIETDESMSPWRKDALSHGYLSAAAFPITTKGKTIGAFALYANEINFFDEDETKLLNELAMDISFAVEVKQNEVERKKAEERTSFSERTYRGIINSIDEAIYIQDKDGTFLDVNDGALKMYGYTREELIGKNPLFVSADGKNDFDEVAAKIALAFNGYPQEFEFWGKKKNGQIFPKQVKVYKGIYFEKEVVIAVAEDITGKKQAIETLLASEERHKSLFAMFRLVSDNSEDLLWAKDLTNNYIFANKTMCEKLLCAKDTDEPIGKDDLFFAKRQREVHPENPEWHTFGEICVNSDEVIHNEKTPKQFDEYGNVKGKFLFLDVRKAPIWDFEGKMVGVVGTARDVTKEKALEKESLIASQKLKESVELFRNLVENITDVFYISDEQGRMKYCSPNFFTFTGFTPQEIIKHIYIRVVAPIDRKRVHEHYTSETEKGVLDTNLELRVQRKDGTIFWAEQNTRIIRDENGNVLEYRNVARDITERKKHEESIRQSGERFRIISNLTSDYIFSTKITEDGKSELDWVMGAFEKITGYTVEEYKAIGGWHALVHPDDREKDFNDFKKLLQREKVVSVVRTINKNGNIVYTRSYASPIWDEVENKLIGIYGAAQDITEQKLAEEEIKKLTQAVEQSAGSIVITDLEGNIEYVNKKFEEITGYTFEDVKNKNPRILKSGETSDDEYKEMWETVLGGNEWRGTFHNKRKDGSLYWESTTISPIKNSEGVITNLLAIKDDITEDKLKEELLKKSELHFRSVWESSLDGMRLADENGNIVSVNNAFANLFEKDKTEIIGKSIDIVYGKDSEFSNVKSFVHCFKNRTIDSFKQRDITLWNGKPMSVERTNSFVEIEGQPALLLSIFRDVTEKKKVEQQIQLLAHSIEGIGECVSVTDMKNKVLFINEAFVKTYGYTKEELIGKQIEIVRLEENKPEKFEQIFVTTLDRGWQGELVNRRKDGSTFPIHLSTSYVKDGDGNPIALIGIASDITETKKAREELILAKDKAEEANKVKTNFLENMSHELRTPMIPILGFTELLSGMDLPDEVKSMAEMMNKSGNRLMDTLNIILDLAQVEKERILVKSTQFNLLQIVDDVCALFQPIAKERNLYLKKEYSIDNLLITSDERMVRHAINNLINNGLKFTHQGGVTLKASVERKGDKSFAVIQICDTGIGIPKGFKEVIWEEFRQASEGIGRSFEGNGLGLTITKNFIEKLNGRVWVESEVGKGSIFTVKLPADHSIDSTIIPSQEVPELAIKTSSLNHEIKTEPSSNKSLRKILYVEDEETSFSVVKYFLKNVVSIDWAKTGQEGVVMARGIKYEAILMDINLAKGIDGMQTTKLIRDLPYYKNIPIIAITAYAMRGDKEEFLGAGCSHYIAKPFTKAALLSLMEEVLTG